MRFLILILVIGSAMAVGLYGFGKNLPKTHHFTEEKVIEAPIEALWEGISNPEVAAKWSPSTTKTERLDDLEGKPVWRYHDSREHFMDVQIVQSKAPFFHVSKIVDTDYPFTGTWVFELVKVEDSKVLVKLTETGEIESPFWRLVIRSVFGVEKGARMFLEELAAQAGNIPMPEPEASESEEGATEGSDADKASEAPKTAKKPETSQTKKAK